MTKKDVIDAVAEKAEISKKDAEAAVNAFTESVIEAVKAGDKVQLMGFGIFEMCERAAREGRNPITGQPMQIEAKKVLKFKPSKALDMG